MNHDNNYLAQNQKDYYLVLYLTKNPEFLSLWDKLLLSKVISKMALSPSKTI